MKISQAGIDLIKSFEGLGLMLYRDPVNLWTIGYGHLISISPITSEDQAVAYCKRIGFKLKQIDIDGIRQYWITETNAEKLLKQDIKIFEDGVNKLVRHPINQYQFDALVSFAFNLGETNLSKSTLLKKINNGNIKGVKGEFIRWNKAGGKVLRGLTRRRQAECDLFFSHCEIKEPVKKSWFQKLLERFKNV